MVLVFANALEWHCYRVRLHQSSSAFSQDCGTASSKSSWYLAANFWCCYIFWTPSLSLSKSSNCQWGFCFVPSLVLFWNYRARRMLNMCRCLVHILCKFFEKLPLVGLYFFLGGGSCSSSTNFCGTPPDIFYTDLPVQNTSGSINWPVQVESTIFFPIPKAKTILPDKQSSHSSHSPYLHLCHANTDTANTIDKLPSQTLHQD